MPDALPERGTDEWRAWAKAEVCRLMSDEGLTLRKAVKMPNMPSKSLVLLWASQDEVFADQYARARDALVAHWAEEIVEISDDASNDTRLVGEAETEVANTEWINRSRLRVDTRKWLLSKLMPKVYGDKVDVSHSVELITKVNLGG